MHMCNGICRDILRFATMWGGVPQMSEILEPSKPLGQALLAPKLLESHSDWA